LKHAKCKNEEFAEILKAKNEEMRAMRLKISGGSN